MKKINRLTAFLLAVMLLISFSLPGDFSHAEEDICTPGGTYPTVFVHGLLGWGDTEGLNRYMGYFGFDDYITDFLEQQGYEVVAPGVGPISSAWDRACELYAQLIGAKTDYGAAHAAKINAIYDEHQKGLHHQRFGRDYTGEPRIKNWGPIFDDEGRVTGFHDQKINLVGHSFGGPTIMLLLQLLAEGDEDEILWGKQQAEENGGDWHDYVSPLFWGDYNGENQVYSITSLAGVLNGTTSMANAVDAQKSLSEIIIGFFHATGFLGMPAIYDARLDHIGLTENPHTTDGEITPYMDFVASSGFLDSPDNALYDLTVAGANELKQGWNVYPDVYYFSYAGDKTYRAPYADNGFHHPDPDMLSFMWASSGQIGKFTDPSMEVKDIYGNFYSAVDEAWYPNDGLVNTISARYPLGAPNKRYDKNNIEPGIWQWEDVDYDHLQFTGLFVNERQKDTRSFYKQIMNNLTVSKDEAKEYIRPLNFIDLRESHPYYMYISHLYQKEIVEGTTKLIFAPDISITRAQLAKMLAKFSHADVSGIQKKQFIDVLLTSNFAPYIHWAVEEKLIEPRTSRLFQPNFFVSRQEMAEILKKFMEHEGIELPNIEENITPRDSYLIGEEYREAVSKSLEKGFFELKNGRFAPLSTVTRAEVAKILYMMDVER